MTDELDLQPLGTFPRRIVGGVHQPSPLDGLAYCWADLVEIGGTERGEPNRIMVAAFARDPEYLTLHGAKDPARVVREMRGLDRLLEAVRFSDGSGSPS